MLARAIPALVVAALCAAAATHAAAQGTEVAAARSLFRDGVAAARDGRWADARDAFQGSFALAPRPNTLLNLARAFEHTGQLVEAAESYRRVIGGADQDPVDDRHIEAARASLAAIESQLAHVALEIEGSTAGAALELDGRSVDWAAVAVELEVNPGAHSFRVLRGGRPVAEQAVEVDEAERATVRLVIPEGPEVAVPSPGDTARNWHGGSRAEPPLDEPEKRSRTGLWVGLGIGGAVLVGLAVGLAVGLSGGSEPGHQGDLGPAWEVP